MPRIPFVDLDNLTVEQRRVYNNIVSGPRGHVRGPLLVALHRPELAEKWQEFGALLRYRTSLSQQLTEIVILTTAQRWRCELEWHLHVEFALTAGIPQSIIDDILLGLRPAQATADMLAIYDYTVQLHDLRRVLPDTYQEVLKRWGNVGTVELTALVGYYAMVAMTLNAHEFPLPDGLEPAFGLQPA